MAAPSGSLGDILLWANLSFCLAKPFLWGRVCFVQRAKTDKSASEEFLLIANSLPYMTPWAAFSILSIILYALGCDEIGLFKTVGIFLAEFVAICLWSQHFEYGRLVSKIVNEVRERHEYLLRKGLGLRDAEVTEHLLEVEHKVVELWTIQLKKKAWRLWSKKEKNALLFETACLSGNCLEYRLWQGVLYDVQAFFSEWAEDYARLSGQSVRVPSDVRDRLLNGIIYDRPVLCVAILLANEEGRVRRARKRQEKVNAEQTFPQFAAVRIAGRKVATEGILGWPSCVSPKRSFDISRLDAGVVNRPGQISSPVPLDRCSDIPECVRFTLNAFTRAGYFKLNQEGPTTIAVKFSDGQMLVRGKQWDRSCQIQRKPFRYVTSATWNNGRVAFVVEQRGGINTTNLGSKMMQVTRLNLIVEAQEILQDNWLEESGPPDENETVWGNLDDDLSSRQVHVLNLPVLYSIKAFWSLMALFQKTWNLAERSQELVVILFEKAAIWIRRKAEQEGRPILPR